MNDDRRLGYPAAAGELFHGQDAARHQALYPLGMPKRVMKEIDARVYDVMPVAPTPMHALLKCLTRGDYDALTGVHLVQADINRQSGLVQLVTQGQAPDYSWLRNTSIQLNINA